MQTTIENRLWLAVHLLYSNASQAFDVYQAVTLQAEHSMAQQDVLAVYTRLVQVYEKIPAISTQMAFYEFEFEQIDQWKVIYKNSQKNQLVIFIGVLIFELKMTDISVVVKLANEKAQFLFQQIFKKLASNSQKLKSQDTVELKRQNDHKISYLFTYENLVDYCLQQLTPEDADKVATGLQIYPTLQIAKEEYTRIIRQIQNLKVQKENKLRPIETKAKLKLVDPQDPDRQNTQITNSFSLPKNTKIYAGLGTLAAVAILSTVSFKLLKDPQGKVVLHEVSKPKELSTAPTPSPTALVSDSVSSTAVASVVEPAVTSTPTPTPTPTETPTQVAVVVKIEKPAEGGLYRGVLFVTKLAETNELIKKKMLDLGAIKAGEVELGWMKSIDMAYYHLLVPEENKPQLEAFLKKTGRLVLKFEKHPRLIPAGQKRFIIEVKQN